MTALVALSTVEEARGRVARIRGAVEDIKNQIAAAYQARDWDTLGYKSWDHYCHEEFGGGIAIPRSDRDDLVFTLRNAGMSYRAIESATDMHASTAMRSVANATVEPDWDDEIVDAELIDEPAPRVTGVNGRQYAATAPPRERSVAKESPGLILDEFLKMISNVVQLHPKVPFDALDVTDRARGAARLEELLSELTAILLALKNGT